VDKMKSYIACSIAFTFLLLPANSGASSNTLPNFRQVKWQLFRGAQPRNEGLKQLSRWGIKTIINLSGEDSKEEGKAANALGLQYFNVPLPALGRPNTEQVNQVIELLNNPNNAPIFVHCKNGKDRTGTIIACYRIAQEGWTAEQALAEAKMFGLGRLKFNLRSYIKEFYREVAAHKNGNSR
jgi:tyrosine-protein phosphatase SIW14